MGLTVEELQLLKKLQEKRERGDTILEKEVNGFLSDDEEVYNRMLKVLKGELGYYHYLKAGVGSGKTRLLFNLALEHSIKLHFVVPNIIVAMELYNSALDYLGIDKDNIAFEEDYMVFLSYGEYSLGKDEHMRQAMKSLITVSTVDQLYHVERATDFYKDRVLVVDEAHYYLQTVDWKMRATLSLEEVFDKRFYRNVLLITATDENIKIFEESKFVDKFENGTTEMQKTLITRTIYPTHYKLFKVKVDESMENVQQSKIDFIHSLPGRTLVLYEKSKEMQELFKRALDDPQVDILNADLKDEYIYQSIVNDKLIPSNVKVIFLTDLLSAGLSLHDKDFRNIVFWEMTNPETTRQLVARFRKATELNVYTFIPDDSVAIRNSDIIKSNQYIILNSAFYRNKLQTLIDEGKETTSIGDHFINNIHYIDIKNDKKEAKTSELAYCFLRVQNKNTRNINYFYRYFEDGEILGEVEYLYLNNEGNQSLKIERDLRKLETEYIAVNFVKTYYDLTQCEEWSKIVRYINNGDRASLGKIIKKYGVVDRYERDKIFSYLSFVYNVGISHRTAYILTTSKPTYQFIRLKVGMHIAKNNKHTGIVREQLLNRATKPIVGLFRKDDYSKYPEVINNWNSYMSILRKVYNIKTVAKVDPTVGVFQEIYRLESPKSRPEVDAISKQDKELLLNFLTKNYKEDANVE